MNFFELQQRARRRSAIYLLLFAAAAAAVVAIADLVSVGVFYLFDDAARQASFRGWIGAHPAILAWTTFVVASIVGGASVYRMASLAAGGGRVAQELGGRRLDPSTPEAAHRALLNVVEEMAIAAGVPVPEVYVLEAEDGINAFAAGFGAADVAIAVTQGALVRLERDELQGAIAHEFSHILNGDTRLNTQLMGALYGIMAVGLTGRLILRALRAARDVRVAVLALVPGAGLATIGYVGLFAGRMIQAAVSRSREYLADASAVQFTRNPAGIAGALKKIAATPFQGILRANTADEVSHMLIADGRKLFDQFFSTHPPLIERIKAIEPRFDPAELKRIKLRPVVIETPSRPAQAAPAVISPAAIVATIGRPTHEQAETARRRRADIPDSLLRAARSRAYAPSLVAALALNPDPGERSRQIARLHERLPEDLAPHLDAVGTLVAGLAPEQRLPLIALAFPAMRQRTPQDLKTLVAAIEEVTRLDGRFDVMDYALVRVLRVHLTEAAAPPAAPSFFSSKLTDLHEEVGDLFSVVARAGDRDVQLARRAYVAGVAALLGPAAPPSAPPEPWIARVDRALDRLDRLSPLVKQSLIEALIVTVTHDSRINLGELELLRAICVSLHCPLPPLELSTGAEETASDKKSVAT